MKPDLIIILVMFFNFTWISLSNTLFYHRFLSHRSFEIQPVLQYVFLFGGLIGYLGSPYSYAIIHRYHHKHSDKDKDPHTPKKSFLWGNMIWLFFYDKHQVLAHKNLAQDLEDMPVVRLGRNEFLINSLHIFYALFLYFLFDSKMVFWGLTLANFLASQFSWMLVASLCHFKQLASKELKPYDTKDNSLNIPWLAIPSFGEAYHNNHHYKPGYSNYNHRKKELDLGFVFLKILEKLKLVSGLKVYQGKDNDFL